MWTHELTSPGLPLSPLETWSPGPPGPPRTHDLFSDGVVSRLQVPQHLRHDLLGVAPVTHSVEEVGCSLSHADVPLRLMEESKWGVCQAPCGMGLATQGL